MKIRQDLFLEASPKYLHRFAWLFILTAMQLPQYQNVKIVWWIQALSYTRVATITLHLLMMLDMLFPDKIEIGDNVVIGQNTTILAHEFLVKEWRIGKVVIEKDVTIGANCTILPGVIIGEGAIVSAMSLVNRDIPAYSFWGGVPVRQIRPAPETE